MTDVTVKTRKSLLRTCAYMYAGEFLIIIRHIRHPSLTIRVSVLDKRKLKQRLKNKEMKP